jgi:hypothetical protein
MVVCLKSTMPDSGRGRLTPDRQNGKSAAPPLFCNYLNGIFESHIFPGNRAKSRFLPGKNATAVSVYLFAINQGAAP